MTHQERLPHLRFPKLDSLINRKTIERQLAKIVHKPREAYSNLKRRCNASVSNSPSVDKCYSLRAQYSISAQLAQTDKLLNNKISLLKDSFTNIHVSEELHREQYYRKNYDSEIKYIEPQYVVLDTIQQGILHRADPISIDVCTHIINELSKALRTEINKEDQTLQFLTQFQHVFWKTNLLLYEKLFNAIIQYQNQLMGVDNEKQAFMTNTKETANREKSTAIANIQREKEKEKQELLSKIDRIVKDKVSLSSEASRGNGCLEAQ